MQKVKFKLLLLMLRKKRDLESNTLKSSLKLQLLIPHNLEYTDRFKHFRI